MGVTKAARPPEGGPTEVKGLSASNLPLISIPHPTRMPESQQRPGKYGSRKLKRGQKKAEIYAEKGKLSCWFCEMFVM